MLKPKKGRLLISDPSLTESTFFKSVVLLTHHNNNESIGLILNKRTDINLHEIVNDIPTNDFPVYIGGPVGKNSIQYIHTLNTLIPNSKEIINDIYWGGDFDVILKLMTEKKISKNQIRFFLGYSGWGIKQLNTEIKEGSWIITTVLKEYLNANSSENLWSSIIKSQKREHAIWANLPKDPNLN